MIKVVCGLSIIDAPWTLSPLVSPLSTLQHHPHQFPAIDVSPEAPWSPFLMEAEFAVAPRHNCHQIPHPEASLGNGELGD